MHLAINGYFLDKPTTGTGQYTLQLLQQLETLWPSELSILVPASFNRDAFALHLSKATLHVLPVPFSGQLGKVWFEQRAMPQAAQRLGADLLHIPYFGPPLRSSVPVIVTIHDLIQLTMPQLRGGPLVRLYNRMATAGACRAASILADSEHTRRMVLAHLPVKSEEVRRVYLAAEQRFCPEAEHGEREHLRERYHLEGPFLLYMGGLDRRKNLPTLIRAYARAQCTAPLAIAGAARSSKSASFPDLQEEARQAGVAHKVRFLGWVDEEDKPALYRAAQLFIFPSRSEGFGLTPLEALACGTPVICSNATSLPEVVGDAALLFDPDDEARLAELIQRAASDSALRDQLRAKGIQQARQFSWRTTAEETIKVYHLALRKERLPIA